MKRTEEGTYSKSARLHFPPPHVKEADAVISNGDHPYPAWILQAQNEMSDLLLSTYINGALAMASRPHTSPAKVTKRARASRATSVGHVRSFLGHAVTGTTPLWALCAQRRHNTTVLAPKRGNRLPLLGATRRPFVQNDKRFKGAPKKAIFPQEVK